MCSIVWWDLFLFNWNRRLYHQRHDIHLYGSGLSICGTHSGVSETSYMVPFNSCNKGSKLAILSLGYSYRPVDVGPMSLSRVLLARVHVISIPSRFLHQRSLHIRSRYRNEKTPTYHSQKSEKEDSRFRIRSRIRSLHHITKNLDFILFFQNLQILIPRTNPSH